VVRFGLLDGRLAALADHDEVNGRVASGRLWSDCRPVSGRRGQPVRRLEAELVGLSRQNQRGDAEGDAVQPEHGRERFGADVGATSPVLPFAAPTKMERANAVTAGHASEVTPVAAAMRDGKRKQRRR
jgi:hypothetical protein